MADHDAKKRFILPGSPERTSAYEAAVAALRSTAHADAAFAEVMSPILEAPTQESLGDMTEERKWWGWLLGRPAHPSDPKMPAYDHIEYRERAGRRTLVLHPYNLSFEQVSGLVDLCRANGLTCEISARSWYFPGRTVAVRIQAASGSEEPRM